MLNILGMVLDVVQIILSATLIVLLYKIIKDDNEE